MKKRVRLTESDLHSIIKESVKKVLREFGSDGPEEVFFDYGDPNQDDSYRELDPSVDFDWVNDLEYYPEAPEGSDEYVPSASDYDSFDDMVESKGRMGRIIRESVKKVMRESGMRKNGMLSQDGVVAVHNNNVTNDNKDFLKKYTPGFKKRKLKDKD